MKPLFAIVVATLVIAVNAHPNKEDAKDLSLRGNEPAIEAEGSEPQERKERCSTCTSTLKLKSPKDILAALQTLPNSEVHTQESFEGCSSERGCAGLKVKDGKVVQKFGNLEAFKAAANANTGNEFQFQAASNGVLEGGVPNGGPFWWMDQNSPFKNAAGAGAAGAGGGEAFEKFSKSSSSSFTSSGNAGGLDLNGNPFLNGDFSKLGAGFGAGAGAGGAGFGAAAGGAGLNGAPLGGAGLTGAGGNFATQKFESSSTSTKEIDISNNPFLNGGVAGAGFGQSGFGAGSQGANFGASGASQSGSSNFGSSQSAFGSTGSSNFAGQNGLNAGGLGTNQAGFNGATGQGGFNSNAFNSNSASKFASGGFGGSSPAPFAPASPSPGANVNLIQNTQKEFDFEQQQQTQQNIDEAFQSTGNVQAHDNSGGALQQTCAGQGYVCVHKAQCNNGVVNTNGAGLLQANTQKQYCNVRNEICCRIETSSLAGAGNLQGNLGVGSATFAGSNQGSGLFSQSGQSGQSGSSQSGSSQSGSSQTGTSQTNQNGFASTGFGSNQASNSRFGSNQASNSGFGSNQATNSGFGSNQATNTNGFSASANRGTSTSQFGAGSSQFGAGSSGFANTNKFAGSSANGAGFGSTLAPTNNGRFGANGGFNEVIKQTSQSNFIETDSFSAGSENAGVFRPGQVGLKPGIPYLPPLDTPASGTNVVSTAYPTPTFVTTPRPFPTPRPVSPPRAFSTPKPTYLPPVPSTSAPEYLPPIDNLSGQESRPSYTEGQLILDDTLPAPFRPQVNQVPLNTDIPAGCAAALKCTPIEFCTAEGVISNTTVVLSREQDAYRVPLTDCKDLGTGRIGKCCRDPLYTDPWPTNQLGKWVPGVFGGNDGRYVPDSRGSPSIGRPIATVRPPTTGSVLLDFDRTTPKAVRPFSPNQITPGFPSSTASPGLVQKNQFGQGSFSQQGQGSFGQGGQGAVGIGGQGTGSQFAQESSFSQTTSSFGQNANQGAGQAVNRGQGSFAQNGQGIGVTQGQGFGVSQGAGIGATRGQGFGVSQGSGSSVNQGFGSSVSQGAGQGVIQGQGVGITQGQGFRATQGQGQAVSQGAGIGVTQGQGAAVNRGQGFGVSRGQSQFTSENTVSQGTGFGVTQGQGSAVSRGQGQAVSQGAGFGVTQNRGQGVSQGAGFGVQGAGFGVSQGAGAAVNQGFGSGVRQGSGFAVSQGAGQGVSQGQGFGVSQGQGFGVSQGQGSAGSQGFGFGVRQGQGQTLLQGQGQALVQGQGTEVTQGFGTGIRQGGGFTVSQSGGFGVENEYGESVQRVFLQRYSGNGQCGIPNPQKPYGNRKDLEVDFAEIPWQAMVLLQTNRSLLCGGVITRPDVVITSASCVEGLQAKNVLIKGGEWKLGIDEEPLPFQIVQVKHILRHPLYKTGSLKNDAAILVLSENLRLAKNIWPICLPSQSDTLDAFYNGAGECVVTGWGKIVLQAHLLGSVMHSVNVSLLNPGECQSKLTQDYPHLLDNYEQDSCVCGEPTNPASNICKVDIGSALACTTGDNRYVMRGIYSWDSGCQTGNQLAAFYKFDLEWYEWAIGLTESVRFAQYTTTTKVTKNQKLTSQLSGVKSSYTSGVKGSSSSGVKGQVSSGASAIAGIGGFGVQGQGQSGEYSQFGSSKYTSGSSKFGGDSGVNFGTNGPISNTFSATYTEKKFFQSEPKIVTYTTKPEIVTFTTKPEYFTFTTKPKIVTYTTKPEIVTFTTKPEIVTYTTKPQYITYETSGSKTNPQYVEPGVNFNPSFSEIVGAKHTHNAQCKCLENGKK